MSDPVRVPDIQSVDWQAQVDVIGGVVEGLDDIDQCIRTILFTPKGSVPHNPDFGSNLWLRLDMPIDEARPLIIQDIITDVGEQEPRVEILAVTCGPNGDNPPALVIEIDRRLKGSTTDPQRLAFQVTP